MLLHFLLLLRVISGFESQKCKIKPYHIKQSRKRCFSLKHLLTKCFVQLGLTSTHIFGNVMKKSDASGSVVSRFPASKLYISKEVPRLTASTYTYPPQTNVKILHTPRLMVQTLTSISKFNKSQSENDLFLRLCRALHPWHSGNLSKTRTWTRLFCTLVHTLIFL